MPEIIYVVGFPKSGNTWLARLLGDALNSPIDSRDATHVNHALADEGAHRKGQYLIKQQHLRYAPQDGRMVLIHRDPRDILLSMADYWELDIDVALEKLLVGNDGAHGLPAFLRVWEDYQGPITFYESLVFDAVATLEKILKILKLKPVFPLEEVIERQSMSARRELVNDDLPYGKDIQGKLLNVGQVGRWRTTLTDVQLAALWGAFPQWIPLYNSLLNGLGFN